MDLLGSRKPCAMAFRGIELDAIDIDKGNIQVH